MLITKFDMLNLHFTTVKSMLMICCLLQHGRPCWLAFHAVEVLLQLRRILFVWMAKIRDLSNTIFELSTAIKADKSDHSFSNIKLSWNLAVHMNITVTFHLIFLGCPKILSSTVLSLPFLECHK